MKNSMENDIKTTGTMTKEKTAMCFDEDEGDRLKKRFSDISVQLGFGSSFYYDIVGSTNDEAKRYVEHFESAAVFWAIEQTGGRGRLGRKWESERGSGIYMSFAIPASCNPSGMTVAVGVALCRRLRDLGYPALLKWPNDILVQGKKVCGILSELVHNKTGESFVVVGVGLNLSRSFDGLLADTALSLCDAKPTLLANEDPSFAFPKEKKAADGSGFLTEGMELVLRAVGTTVLGYDSAEKSAFVDWARKYSATIDREVEVHHVHDRTGYFAIARDIDADGALIVELRNGERRKIVAGEVTLRRECASDI